MACLRQPNSKSGCRAWINRLSRSKTISATCWTSLGISPRRLSLTRRLSRSTSASHLSNLYLSVRSYLTRDAERPLMLTVLSLPRDATLYPSRTYAPRARQRRLAHAPTDPRTIPRRSKQWERWQSALELHRQSDGTLGSQDSLRQEDLRAGITQLSAETQKGRR